MSGLRPRSPWLRAASPRPAPRLSVAVASGKGGVGKTNLVTNLAVVLAGRGQRVLLVDGDLSLANVDLLLGVAPRHTLYDVVTGAQSIERVVLHGARGVDLLPAASGLEGMADLDEYRRENLLRLIGEVARTYDVLLVDTGAGIHRQNLRLAASTTEILVLTTPEPPAFADAYATLKVLAGQPGEVRPRLVVNMVRGARHAARVAERLQRVTARFLGFSPELLGFIPRDEQVRRAVRAQRPFVLAAPRSPASLAVGEIAARLLPRSRPTREARARAQRVA